MDLAIRSKLAEIKFPREQERLTRQAAVCRSASPEEKLGMLLEVIDLAEVISGASPHRARQLSLLQENERREHEVLRGFIRAHTRTRRDEGGSPRSV